MSDAEAKNYKRPGDEEDRPTASFSGSVAGPGGRIGQFQIERELGRGAVGVVYLAHDTKLDRSVAIKSLPAEVMDNPKARSRFSREARLLASVNHPNIATIHEVLEESEGVGYLILEYVAGQTLAERIAESGFKPEESLSIALQIAEAVAAAHEHDVIHRDLKPGNIKITPEGKVKVLDFGLAKAVGGEAAEQQSTVTEPGRVIGTPAYMSPEQARGKPADKRSDIWSFGCVLYEMLTDKVPFEGETASDTLAHILERDPNWNALPQATPANIKVLIRRCLEKDPRRRLQHIGDATIEIRETMNLPAVVPPVSVTTITRPAPLRRLIPAAVATLALTVVLTGLITRSLLSPPQPLGTVRLSVPLPPTEYIPRLSAMGLMPLALSHDGAQLAYVSNTKHNKTQLYIRSMDNFQAKPISGAENAYNPFFSPDGQWLAFFTQEALDKHSLWKVRTNGDAPKVRLATSEHRFDGGSWGDDIIIFCGQDPNSRSVLYQVSADGGEPEPLLKAGSSYNNHYPQILPGGKAVMSGLLSGRLLSLETGERTKLIDKARHIRYSPTGHLIFARDEQLLAVPFDVDRLKVTGPEVPVLEDACTRNWASLPYFAVAGNGTLAYTPVSSEFPSLVWVDRQGNAKPVRGAPSRSYTTPRLSPDETELAVGVEGQVWRYDLTRNVLSQFTFGGSHNVGPLWTPPQGKRIYFGSAFKGEMGRELFWKSIDGSGMTEPFLPPSDSARIPHSWSPDGKYLAYHEYRGEDSGIWILPIGDDGRPGEPALFKSAEHKPKCPMFSPLDGRYVAYISHKTGEAEVYIKEFLWGDLQAGREERISSEGGTEPCWSRDGSRLFYRSAEGMMEVTVESRADGTIEVSQSQLLFEDNMYDSFFSLSNYDVTSDGRFLMIKAAPHRQINVILNWAEELERLAPTGK